MGEYPRLASFALDTDSFCAKIVKMTPNPLENEMTQYHDDEWIDVDDGMIDVESFGEMIEDFHEDDYYDDSMDGDHESAFGSCGWGVDEQYNIDYDYGEDW